MKDPRVVDDLEKHQEIINAGVEILLPRMNKIDPEIQKFINEEFWNLV